MACVEACPAFIGHVDTFIDIRRNEVNMKGRVHPEAARVLRSIEAAGNPFGAQEDRIEWVDTLDVPVIGPGETCDVLYWIGCLTTFDTTKQQIALDVIELLKKCDIDFGVLGPGELCCGDPARVTGDENLFQACAKQQVEELNQRKFKTLLTACPHCFNVLKNEYPQFGGSYHVVHHTQFLEAQLLQKKLVPHEIGSKVVVYHDPCYLGRYQDIYQPPRNVLNSIPAIRPREMKNSRGKSFCCGGGGGHFWMDIREGERINNLRIEQAAASGADIITTACPFCRHMLEDSLKLMDLEEKMQIEDVASLLSRSLKQG
jgi:Fe-S oxidoreductase